MAAPAGTTVGAGELSDDSSSSSDGEALRRCREAVWETRTHTEKDDDKVKESKRVVVADHEHDGNELQVTKGFQTHVAKKLGSFLDSRIAEVQVGKSSRVGPVNGDDDEDDEGFRLFSTSVPGRTAEEPPAPVRRRPIPSSSDSDSEMEMRLKEAAVSFKDLVPSLASPPASTDPPCAEEEEEKKKKKKKKKKPAETEETHLAKKKRSEEPQPADSSNTQRNGEHADSQQGHVKVKKKKKTRREGKTEEALN